MIIVHQLQGSTHRLSTRWAHGGTDEQVGTFETQEGSVNPTQKKDYCESGYLCSNIIYVNYASSCEGAQIRARKNK